MLWESIKERAVRYLNSKWLYVFSTGFLLLVGLAYYYINNKRIVEPDNSLDAPATNLSGSGSQTLDVVVDVSGAVNKPGLYKTAEGSRVGDVIALAEGISSDASIIYVSRVLNLAQKVHDSEKIYVPFEMDFTNDASYEISALAINLSSGSSNNINQNLGNTTSSGSSSNVSSDPNQIHNVDPSAKISVNTSSVEDLDKLPGIGPAYANRIVENRPYKDYEDLVSKSKVSESVLEKIKDLISY